MGGGRCGGGDGRGHWPAAGARIRAPAEAISDDGGSLVREVGVDAYIETKEGVTVNDGVGRGEHDAITGSDGPRGERVVDDRVDAAAGVDRCASGLSDPAALDAIAAAVEPDAVASAHDGRAGDEGVAGGADRVARKIIGGGRAVADPTSISDIHRS